jgi:hypothetical protein
MHCIIERERAAGGSYSKAKNKHQRPRSVISPSFTEICPLGRGSGESRMPTAPAASRAKEKSTRASHHRFGQQRRLSPREWFYGFLRALPGDRALLSPSPRNAKHCRELTSASRGQDHTTSPSTKSAVRRSTPSRPSQPAPNVRDDREAPLFKKRGPAETSGGDLPDGASGNFRKAVRVTLEVVNGAGCLEGDVRKQPRNEYVDH